jgi:hypothetical protein
MQRNEPARKSALGPRVCFIMVKAEPIHQAPPPPLRLCRATGPGLLRRRTARASRLKVDRVHGAAHGEQAQRLERRRELGQLQTPPPPQREARTLKVLRRRRYAQPQPVAPPPQRGR